MIDESTKNRILETAQVLDVVSDFVTLHRRGVNYVGLCPFHNERTPSFTVSPARGTFKCFGCGKGGDAARFLMEHEQMTFPEALRWLANKYGIPIEERELTNEERLAQSHRESLFIINEFACQWCQQQLYTSSGAPSIGLAYLHSRGFRDDIIRKFQLGYCPESVDAMCRDAMAKGYKKELLLEAGVAYQLENGGLRDRFHDRVMFPIHSLSGKVIAFSGRVMQSKPKVGKYVNSPETDIYTKSNELYGIWLAKSAIVKQDKCYLVEGNADVVSMHQAGVENVVASCGTALTKGQIRKIHRFTNNVTVLYDGDSAGIHASQRGIDMFLEEGMNVKVVLLPDGEDPDSYARQHNATEFVEFITRNEVDFIRFKTQLLLGAAGNDPFKRAELIKEIVLSISKIPDSIVRATYITACSQMLGTDEKILINEVNRLRREQKSAQPAAPAGTSGSTPTAPPPPPPAQEAAPASPDASMAESHPTEVPAAPPSAPTTQPTTPPDPLHEKERLLIQQIIRHGEEIVCQDEMEDGTLLDISVAEFILGDMQADELQFTVPLYARVADEALNMIGREGYKASRHFLHHEDAAISALAAELIGDRYELSRSFATSDITPPLAELVSHLLNDFKMTIVERELKMLMAQLRDPAVCADTERSRTTMQEIKNLTEARNKLAQMLGQRVVAQSNIK